MKQEEFFHLHKLIYEVADFIDDKPPEERLIDYSDLSVGPMAWYVSKEEQEQAFSTIIDSFTDSLRTVKMDSMIECFKDRI